MVVAMRNALPEDGLKDEHAAAALTTPKGPQRHHTLDDYARLYGAVDRLLRAFETAGTAAVDVPAGVDVTEVNAELAAYRDAILAYVCEEHEHAVRWTLTGANPLPYEPDREPEP